MSNTTAVWITVILIAVVVVAVLAVVGTSGKGTSTPKPVPSDVIDLIDGSSTAYEYIRNPGSETLDEVATTARFFADSYFVRDDMPDWYTHLARTMSSDAPDDGAIESIVGWPMSNSFISSTIWSTADAINKQASGEAIPPEVFSLIRESRFFDTANTKQLDVLVDGSVEIDARYMNQVVASFNALDDLSGVENPVQGALAVLAQSTPHINDSRGATRGSKLFWGHRQAFASINGASFASLQLTTPFTIQDGITAMVDPIADMVEDYAYCIPFGEGGLEISQGTGSNGRCVWSNLYLNGAIKCYWESTQRIRIAYTANDQVTVIYDPNGGFVIDDEDGGIVSDDTATVPLECRYFNIVEPDSPYTARMVGAASGKYDPDTKIYTAVLAGIGFICDMNTGKFGAQQNQVSFDPTIEPKTNVSFKFEDPITVDTADNGFVGDAGKSATVNNWSQVLYGTLTSASLDSLRAQVNVAAESYPSTLTFTARGPEDWNNAMRTNALNNRL